MRQTLMASLMLALLFALPGCGGGEQQAKKDDGQETKQTQDQKDQDQKQDETDKEMPAGGGEKGEGPDEGGTEKQPTKGEDTKKGTPKDGGEPKTEPPDGETKVETVQKPIDVRFVTEDAFAVVVLRPDRILKSKVYQSLPSEQVVGQVRENSGIDLTKVRQVVAYAVPAPEGEGGPAQKPAKEETPPAEPAEEKPEEGAAEKKSEEKKKEPAPEGEEKSAPEERAEEAKQEAGAAEEAAAEEGVEGEGAAEEAEADAAEEGAAEEGAEPADAEPADAEPADTEPADAEPADRPEPGVDEPGVAVGPPAKPPFVPGVVVYFTEAVDKEAIIQAYELEEAEKDGRTWYKPPRPDGPHVLFGGETTMLMAGSEELLWEMLSAEDVETPLTKRLAGVDEANDLVAVFRMEETRQAAEDTLEQSPERLGEYGEMLENVETLTLVGNLAPGIQLDLIADASSEEAATKLGESLGAQIAMAKQVLTPGDQLAEVIPFNLGPVLVPIAQETVAGMKPTVEGREVRLTIKAPEQLTALIASLGPVLKSQAAQQASRQSTLNNYRVIALALHSYHDVHRHFPPAAKTDEEGKPLLSWRVLILPYLEGGPLYDQFHLDEPWDSEHNIKLVEKMPAVYASEGGPADGTTAVQVPIAKGTIFGGEEPGTLGAIKDGTSHTIMLVQAADEHRVPWTKPQDLEIDPDAPSAKLPAEGFLAAFADGSVRMLSGDLDMKTLWALFTIAGGEEVEVP